MTFDEYINNPMGIKNSVISNREMYRTMYMTKLDKILVRETGTITYKLYKDKNKYYCYMKIPSEVVPNFYYDVIAEFTEPKDKKIPLDATLKNYNVRFFSNDPSFVFTFCHAFIKNKLFITDYSDKMSKEAIKKRAVEKNPQEIVGYVKSLYFMYLIMRKKDLFLKIKYSDLYNEKTVKKEIMEADKKIHLRQESSRKKSIEKKKEKQQLKDNINRSSMERGIHTTNSVKSIKSTGVTKKTNAIKRTKKI